MNTATHYYMRGMGATSGAQLGLQLGTTAAQAVVPTVLGSTVGGLLGFSGAAALSVGIPVVGAAIAGISIAIEAILNSGCGQTCIVTSQWANQAEGYLKQNIDEYFKIPTPRPQSVQQIAMANFKAIWNTLVQQCSQPGLSTAGKDCIADRQDGACKWKATAPEYPGQPATGACWNWWNGYYYPIANDPNVAASGPLQSATTGMLSGSSDSGTFLLIGAAVLGVVLLVGLT